MAGRTSRSCPLHPSPGGYWELCREDCALYVPEARFLTGEHRGCAIMLLGLAQVVTLMQQKREGEVRLQPEYAEE